MYRVICKVICVNNRFKRVVSLGGLAGVLILIANNVWAETTQPVLERFGVVRYNITKTVYSSSAGVLEKVHVKAGQKVSLGAKLVTIKPIDPSFRKVIVANDLPNAIVTRVELLEGKKIGLSDEILVVADDSQYIVVTQIAGKYIRRLDYSVLPSVKFNPGSEDSFTLEGLIHAVHEPPQGRFGLFTVEVLVTCPTEACTSQVRSGDFAKVLF